MKKISSGISCNHNNALKGETVCLTLVGENDESITLELDERQYALMQSRRVRPFYIKCAKEKILREIDDADNCETLECIAKKYYLCDACSFDGINLLGVKRILKVIVNVLYKYPLLRGKLCFLGTHHDYEKLLVRLERGDKDILNEFYLQYICSPDNAAEIGRIVHNMLTPLICNPEAYVATAICAFGLFDAVLLDKNDYDGYAYLKLVMNLRLSQASGYHPKGCGSTESIVYHELGHLLDDMCGLSDSDEFKEYYSSLSEKEIKRGLSKYALSSPKEFIAEAFAESMCNPAPRSIAVATVKLLDSKYNEIQ